MEKRQGAVTFKGNPATLVGPQLKPGDPAPDFACATQSLEIVGLGKTPAKARLSSVVPSLDTPVCSQQTKKFDEAGAALGDRIASYTISLDLPFAQKRFCSGEGIKSMQTLSDVHNGSFGQNYGVRIEGLPIPLLSRAVFVVGRDGRIAYAEYVPEVTSHPDYDKALAALKAAVCPISPRLPLRPQSPRAAARGLWGYLPTLPDVTTLPPGAGKSGPGGGSRRCK